MVPIAVKFQSYFNLILIVGGEGALILAAQFSGLKYALLERGLSLRLIIRQETLQASQQHLWFGWA